MQPEDLKTIEYSFNKSFILYINGTEAWKMTRSEFAESLNESSFKMFTLRVQVQSGEFMFAVYPRFKNQTVKIIGPLKLMEDKRYALSEEKMDWIIGIKRIDVKPEFGTLKEKAILDKLIGDYERAIMEYKRKIKESEEIMKLLEKLRSDKKWK